MFGTAISMTEDASNLSLEDKVYRCNMFQGVLLKKVFRSVRKESCMKSGLSLEMAAFAVLSSELGFSK